MIHRLAVQLCAPNRADLVIRAETILLIKCTLVKVVVVFIMFVDEI